ncbi:MAG: hypothetical protein WA137_10435 [Methanothrix sp.]
MRRQLQLFLGEKYLFSADVAKFGLREVAYRGAAPTMLLENVLLHSGTIIVPIDHLWTYAGKSIARFNPRKGDRISFNAWVREYYKTNYNTGEERLDYCIGRLSALDLVTSNGGPDFATFWNWMRNSRKFVTNSLDGVMQDIEEANTMHAAPEMVAPIQSVSVAREVA